MATKKHEGYLSARESRRISRENRKITDRLEKLHKRKNVPESEYLTTMKDEKNSLEIDNLHSYFFTDVGTVRAVDGISFEVPIGKTVGVVGESGCGKSVTSLSIMQLLQRPQGQVVDGQIRLNLGDKAYDITKVPGKKMQELRGNYVSMIFQEPMTSLNPVFRIGDQIDEVIALHDGEGKSSEEIKERTIELLELAGIANSQGVYKMYPHELSGGMMQRVSIALSLINHPRLVIFDEATTALDVITQGQILKEIQRLEKELGLTRMMITHDISVVATSCTHVAVLYAGRLMEVGPAASVLRSPAHPYTAGLMAAFPSLTGEKKPLQGIPGSLPDLTQTIPGCVFAPRCPYATEACRAAQPPLETIEPGWQAACHHCLREVSAHG